MGTISKIFNNYSEAEQYSDKLSKDLADMSLMENEKNLNGYKIKYFTNFI